MASSEILILPGDVQEDIVVKRMREMTRDSREREFEHLKSLGYDNETAAHLSGLNELDPDKAANVRLKHAWEYGDEPLDDVVRSVTHEVPHAFRNVGATAGAAIAVAAGNSLLATATKHGETLGIILGTALTIGVGYATTRFVHRALGAGWAAAALINIVSATAIVGTAWWKIGRRP